MRGKLGTGNARESVNGRGTRRGRFTNSTKSLTFRGFLKAEQPKKKLFTFLSLFSGAGIGDFGFSLAGGKCVGACEIDPNRRAVHAANHGVRLWDDIRKTHSQIVAELADSPPDVIVATPPCQSFSTANSRRGLRLDPEHAQRDERNNLFFDALKIIKGLRPKIAVFENVPNFLERLVLDECQQKAKPVKDWLAEALSEYREVSAVACFSILGVPQRRKRALCVFVRHDIAGVKDIDKDLEWVNWPGKLTRTPRSVATALKSMRSLDGGTLEGSCDPEDDLHNVPVYNHVHYSWISNIPPYSGTSAWDNVCSSCGSENNACGEMVCSNCQSSILSRPHVLEAGRARPIRGFKTSYRRMAPDELAPTITTSSGHFSSDIKIHFSENRVLSPRECAWLQTIPDSFRWPIEQRYKKNYLIREMIGEAVPPLVSFRLGLALTKIMF